MRREPKSIPTHKHTHKKTWPNHMMDTSGYSMMISSQRFVYERTNSHSNHIILAINAKGN